MVNAPELAIVWRGSLNVLELPHMYHIHYL